MVNKLRPNTGIEDVLLSPNIILCCGEDWQELVRALGGVTSEPALLHHEYRIYRVSKFRDFSLIWSGIGTGCLEPLLCELRSAAVIRNIILIGTAGAGAKHRLQLEEIYIAQPAFLAGTAVHVPEKLDHFSPRFPQAMLDRLNLKPASIASTDYYYGFSKNPDSENLRVADKVLHDAVNKFFDKVDLIDMETAQFYYFCEQLFAGRQLNYVALKGAANYVDRQDLQTTHSLAVLQNALTASFVLLDLPAQKPAVENATPAAAAPPDEGSATKLIAEVKLFWTIQIAVCSVLGYMGTNLTFSPTPPASLSDFFLKNISISVISFILIQIGAMYNVIGNYYAYLAGVKLGYEPENGVTPTLAFFYSIISGGIASLALKTGSPDPGIGRLLLAFVGGMALNYLVCRWGIYWPLAQKKMCKSYREYAKPLRIVYDIVMGITIAVAVVWYFKR